MSTKLIVLRGPSGAGKSSVTAELIRRSARKIAVIEQDMFRVGILRMQDGFKQVGAVMCRDAVTTALQNGFDVIADGIFKSDEYRQIFEDIAIVHSSENYFYYFDIPLEETFRRHQSRAKANDFGIEELTKWYKSASPLGYEDEQIIDQGMSLDVTVDKIISQTQI